MLKFLLLSLLILPTSSVLAEPSKKLPDGSFLRTGWISADKKGCGKYSRTEWGCFRDQLPQRYGLREEIKAFSGCARHAPICASGRAYAVNGAKGGGCVKSWTLWECHSKPMPLEEKLSKASWGHWKDWIESIQKIYREESWK